MNPKGSMPKRLTLVVCVLLLGLPVWGCASQGRPPSAATASASRAAGTPASSMASSSGLLPCGKEGDPRGTIEGCTRAIDSGRLDPSDRSLALTERALGYMNEEPKDLGHALADAEAAIRANPDNSYAYRTRGLAYALLGQDDKAIADYNTAIRIDPREPYHYFVRGGEYLAIGRREEAERDFAKAKELDPGLAPLIEASKYMARALN